MIDVETWGELVLVAGSATLASCLFATVTMNYFRTRCRWHELALLWEVEALKVPSVRPSEYWLYFPALLLIAGVWWMQGLRRERVGEPSMATT